MEETVTKNKQERKEREDETVFTICLSILVWALTRTVVLLQRAYNIAQVRKVDVFERWKP